jgi:protein-disulfide isomerase
VTAGRGSGQPHPDTRAVATVPPSRKERRRLEREERARTGPRVHESRQVPIWRSPTALITGLAIVAGLIVVIAVNRGQAPSSIASDLNLPPTSYDPRLVSGETLGRADAPVTLEVWSDFQCPFCGQLARTYLPKLVADFVVGGQLRIVPRDVDFVGRGEPNESVEAAVAASCASDQGKYWQYHDVLLWNQAGENRGAFNDARLRQMADQVGLDRGAWDQCRTDPARTTAVATTTSAALAAGINGTPTLMLNGVVTTSGMPRTYEDLTGAVQAALAAAPTAP